MRAVTPEEIKAIAGGLMKKTLTEMHSRQQSEPPVWVYPPPSWTRTSGYGYTWGPAGSMPSSGLPEVPPLPTSAFDNPSEPPVHAEFLGDIAPNDGKVKYTWIAGHPPVTMVGDHPTRDNNPVDVSANTTAHGDIGSDNGGGNNMAVFANVQDGYNAAERTMININNNDYGGNATLDQIISKYSPPTDLHGHVLNNTAAMQTNIPSAAGLSGSTHWSSLTKGQKAAFIDAYAVSEGYNGGS